MYFHYDSLLDRLTLRCGSFAESVSLLRWRLDDKYDLEENYIKKAQDFLISLIN